MSGKPTHTDSERSRQVSRLVPHPHSPIICDVNFSLITILTLHLWHTGEEVISGAVGITFASRFYYEANPESGSEKRLRVKGV